MPIAEALTTWLCCQTHTHTHRHKQHWLLLMYVMLCMYIAFLLQVSVDNRNELISEVKGYLEHSLSHV